MISAGFHKLIPPSIHKHFLAIISGLKRGWNVNSLLSNLIITN